MPWLWAWESPTELIGSRLNPLTMVSLLLASEFCPQLKGPLTPCVVPAWAHRIQEGGEPGS